MAANTNVCESFETKLFKKNKIMIPKKIEAYFIPHCDNETCDLGRFQYTCTHCNKTVSDYDVWWKQDDILPGNPETFNCEECRELLTVEWDSEKGEYWVS